MKKYNDKKEERGALSISGARNPNLKIYWSVERYHISERGALIKKARSVEHQFKNSPERGALETPGRPFNRNQPLDVNKQPAR